MKTATLQEYLEDRKDSFEFDIKETDIIQDKWKSWHWAISIAFEGREIEIDYYGGEQASCPGLLQVMESLHSDYWCLGNKDSVDEFLLECGYAENLEAVRAGEEIHEDIQKNNEKLRYLLGDEFDIFVNTQLD